MTIATDRIASVRSARDTVVTAIGLDPGAGESGLIAAGLLAGFRTAWGRIIADSEGATIDAQVAQVLGLQLGDAITWVGKS